MNANTTPTVRVADWLMKQLADLGLGHVHCLPGGGAMHLNDALVLEPRLHAVVCHHEQACGIAAEAYGRTHRCGFGAALVTTGPGATNVLTPVAGAWIESLPLLVISGQVKRADLLNGRPLRQCGVQEVDVVAMVKPVTKFAVTVMDPLDIGAVLEEALWQMRTGRPGPVWIDIPLDVQAAPLDPSQLRKFVPPVQPSAQTDVTPQLARLAQLLAQAKRPLVMAGHGVRIAGGADAFKAWVQQLGIPCALTWNASDLLSWDDPLYVGRPGVVAARAPNFAVQNADLLITIGCRLDNVVTAYNPKDFARHAVKVVIDVDPEEIAKHPFSLDLAIESDARQFLEDARRFDWQAAPGQWNEWVRVCRSWKDRYSALEGRDLTPRTPMNHYAFIDALSDLLPPDHQIITGSSGLAVEVFYSAFRNKPGQRIFLTSGLGAMGYGLPAAMGACQGAGGLQTYCIESDGSLMLNLQELATLQALQLPITLIVMNNQGYASIRNTQNNYFKGRLLGSDPSSGLWMPDFCAIAQAMGLAALTVRHRDELRDALAMSMDGPRLINVMLLPQETLAPKSAALPQPDGSMLSMPLEDMSPLLPLEVMRREMLVPLSLQSLKARDR